MTYPEKLKEDVKVAVKKSVGWIVANHPGESLDGYAITTDDNLCTLGFVASTKEWLETHSEAPRFEPVDWVYNDGVEAFDEPGALLASASEGTGNLIAHVKGSFNALVEALQELRSEGLFGSDVFLTVISTDPNELLERLEAGAVRALNSVEIHRQWQESIGIGY